MRRFHTHFGNQIWVLALPGVAHDTEHHRRVDDHVDIIGGLAALDRRVKDNILPRD